MDHFELRDGELYCEDVPLAEIAARGRHARLRLFDGDDVPPRRGAALGAGAAWRPADRLCGEGQSQQRGDRDARARRASAPTWFPAANIGAPSPRALPADKIVFSGVGKTEEEMRLALEGGLYQFNLELLAEAEMLSAVAIGDGADRPGRLPGQPRRRRRRPRQDHHRLGREQVRDRDRRCARGLCSRRRLPGPRSPGRRRPYRQPADQPRSARARLHARRRADRRASRAPATTSASPISAAVLASPTTPTSRRRQARPNMARWSAASPAAGTCGWCSSRGG